MLCAIVAIYEPGISAQPACAGSAVSQQVQVEQDKLEGQVGLTNQPELVSSKPSWTGQVGKPGCCPTCIAGLTAACRLDRVETTKDNLAVLDTAFSRLGLSTLGLQTYL